MQDINIITTINPLHYLLEDLPSDQIQRGLFLLNCRAKRIERKRLAIGESSL